MTRTQTAGAGVALVAAAFASGRYSAPEKLHVETKTVEVHSSVDERKESVAQATDRDVHYETVVTELVRPDGTRQTTTRTIEDRELRRSTQVADETVHATQNTREKDQVRDEVRSSRKLDISVLAGPSMSLSSGIGQVVYGVHVSRPILGPVTVGLFGMSNGVAGVSVGLQF